MRVTKNLTEGRRNYEFISEISQSLHEKGIFKQYKYIDGDLIKEVFICNICFVIQGTNAYWIEILMICVINSEKLLKWIPNQQ